MDLENMLGASRAASLDRFSIYLPDRDRHSQPISDIEAWIEAAANAMADANSGVTRLSPAVGMWRSPDAEMVQENTTVLYSFIRDRAEFERELPTLVALLHTYGRDTNQGEVMVEFSGGEPGSYTARAYFISEYSQAAA